MQIVINMSEEKYNQIINHYKESNVRPKDYEIAIINGTPLTNVLNMISKEIDALKNYSYAFSDMIFHEVHKVIDKYKG